MKKINTDVFGIFKPLPFQKLVSFLMISIFVSGCSLSASIERGIESIIAPESFRVVPPSADVTEGGVLALTGENGEPPYTFEKVSGTGVVSAGGAFTAASTGTSESVTVKATDKNGKIAFAVFNIVKAPEILPKTQTLAVLNKFKFSVSGGKAPYAFSMKTGGGAITPEGEYTAPATVGTATIEVVDALGGKDQGTITIVPGLQFTAPNVTMATNTNEIFTTTGGVPPVVISIESGLGSFDPGTGTYSAPGVSGIATLIAHDSLGNEARSKITINSSLLINPPMIELVINSQHTFTATGGVPPYSYTLVSGAGSVTLAGVYSAPAAIGTAQVRVTDSKGSTSDSMVNINPELSFIFPNISVLVNETKNLSLNVIGGAPPLTYSVSLGAGVINSSTGVFVAGGAPGVYTATVMDSKGYSAQASVTIQPPMAITPLNATLMAGTTLSYGASGGTPPYIFSVATGGGSFTGSVYTAPLTAQTATVRATDSLGNFVTTNVTVAGVLQITPSTLSMIVNGTQTFIAAGGIPPYAFKILSGAGTIDSTSGLFTAPPVEGTAIVEVVDSQSNHAQSSVTILDQVRIVPSPLSMVKNSSLTVLATGGLGPYTFSIVAGDGTISSSTGLFESADNAGTVTVKATDALGNFGTGTIVVYDSLTIDNAPDAIMVGETVTLAASGGALPYVYSVVDGASSGSIDSSSGLLTASMTPGIVKVRVTDSLSQTYEKSIEVRALLALIPTTLTLAPTNTFQFSATGGVGSYTYALVSGAGSMSSSGLYTAPASSGTAIVKVTDAGGRTAQANITITNPLSLTPALSNIKYSDTQSLTAAGGVAPYIYSKISGPGSVDPSTGLFTAGVIAGTSILRATDALGNYAEATVITIAPVEITPAAKDLAFSEVFSFTALKGLPPYTFSITSGGGSINAASGSFTAPTSAGTTVVRVTDSLNQTASATITVYEALLISPLSASIATSQTQNLSATGGVPPYTYSLMSGTGSVQTGPDSYVAAATTTTAKVKVTDNLGNFSIGTINVVGAVTISPTTLTLAVNETRTFSGLGGSTPYTFSVQSGGGSVNASSGAYTAPGSVGTATVRITDALNQTADATVTIVAALSLSPATVTLAVGNQQQFTPSGGVGPFTYDIQSGSGSVNSSGLFTAGGSSGSAVVRVTDSEGRTATSTVTINGALAISPTTAELIFAGTQTFTASGGLGPYSYTVVTPGTGSVGVSTGAYVAPSLAGTETVRVTDSLGNTSNATVTIVGPVQISPTTKSLVIGDTFTFTASGGKTPYAYSVSVGGGSITNAGVYTASNTIGSYTVRVTDSLGQISDSEVTLTPSVSLSPATATLAINNQQQFTASDGTGPYTYSIQSGLGSVNSSGLFTAGASAGTSVVKVTDSAGRTATATVTVNGALTISPTTKDLIFAGTQTFVGSGGVGPYSYTVVIPGAGSVGVSTGAYTAPSVAGTESVRVTDALGNTADAVVTIIGPVQISPTTKTLAVGEVFTFTASGGKTAYTYGVSVGGGAITNAGVYTAGTTTGSYTVRVTDSLGQYSDSVVTLIPAIDLAPDTNSIRIGQTQVLTRTGGTAPFTYTVVSGGGTFNDGTMTYTPPNSLTTAIVRVTDNVSNTDDVTITVTAGVPAAIAYVTSAQTVQAGACSGVTTVKLQDAYSNDTTATASTTVNFAASNLTFYSDSSCSSVVTSQVIASGASQASVYFKGSVSGLQIVTASATGLSSSMQTETITAATLAEVRFSPASLTVLAGDCSAVTQLRLTDTMGNPGSPASNVSVALAATGVTYFTDASCSSSLTNPVVLSNGTPTQNLYVKKTMIGATSVTAVATGYTTGNLALTVNPNVAYKLAYITQPSANASASIALATQPKLGVYDQYDNLLSSATTAITLSPATNVSCSSSAGGTLGATTNPLSATSGEAQFAGISYDSPGNIYLKASASGLVDACSTQVSVVADYTQSLVHMPANIPSDNLAEATLLVIPKKGNPLLGTGQTIEITSSSATVTMTCHGSACSACQTPAATCVKAYDNGQGAYSITAKNSVAETVTFTARHNESGVLSMVKSISPVFNSANFTTINTTSNVTSANQNQNLYLTGGTITFDATTVGRTFGDVFVRGATVTHAATSTTVVYSIDISVGSLTVQSGLFDVSGKGYMATGSGYNYSYGPTAPGLNALGSYRSNASYSGGGSHGGIGATNDSAQAGGITYGDYRDPGYPGGAGWSAGGGIVRISSASTCAVYSGASINASGASGGAGGSIKLSCAGFVGNAGASAVISSGGASASSSVGGGGGGRIALISTGEKVSFAGSFGFPSDNTVLTSFNSVVRARGGTNANPTYNGAAGTVFVKHSGLTYGGLIIHNGNSTSLVSTVLPSISNTAGTVSGSSLPFGTALPTGSVDLYKNMRLRPNLAADNGTATNLLDDNIVTITSHTLAAVTAAGSLAGVTNGVSMRTLEVLDYLNVSGTSTLSTGSDVVVLAGDFISPTQMNFTNGVMAFTGNGAVYPDVNQVTLSAGTYSGSGFKAKNIIMSGATANYSGTVTGETFTMNSGTYTGGTVSSINTILNGGTYSVTSTVTTQDLTVTGGTNTSVTSTVGRDLVVSGGTSTLDNINITRNLSMSAGTLTHSLTTTATVGRMNMNVGNDFNLLGGTINVSARGYTNIGSGYSYSYGPTGPATVTGFGAYRSNTSNAGGGSHGGVGGINNTSQAAGVVYGDYRDPNYPGGGSHTSGGGVVRVSAVGICTINSGATVIATGGVGGAGGSIKLSCGGLAGTAGAGAINASGGSSTDAQVGAGGGGRIALISTGGLSSFAGNFAFPSDNTSLTAFNSLVQARGGSNSLVTSNNGHGAAGSIFVKHSGLTYGGLIIHNGNILSTAKSMLPSISNTAGVVSGSSLPLGSALPSGYVDLYKNMRIRPNLSADNGTSANLLDDNIVTITANTLGALTISGSLSGVTNGVSMRTIEVLDYLNVGGAATLATGSDIVVLSGDFISTTEMNFTDGALALSGGALSYPDVNQITMANGIYSGTNFNTKNLVIGGATVTYTGTTTSTNFTMNSGTFTGGAVSATSVTLNGGTYTTSTTTAAQDLVITGGTNISATNNAGRDLLISGGTSTLDTLNVTRDFTMSAGTLTHAATNASAAKRMLITAGNEFNLLGGTIDVTGKGYEATGSSNNNSYGATLQSTLIGSYRSNGTNSAGGSHAGVGGSNSSSHVAGATYGDYRDPNYPGGAGYLSGGGVVRVSAVSTCTINSGAVITAAGGAGGAGGSVKLACSGFAGTAGTGAINASGAAATGTALGAGGGGRVALISTGGIGSFAGSFSFPTDNTKMSNFNSIVQARGGVHASGAIYSGAAGTVYLKHSGLTYGGLIIYNGNNTATAHSILPSINNTAGTVAGSSLPLVSSLAAGYVDLYKNMRLRPNLTANNGTPLDLLDDNTVTISANTLTTLTVTGSLAGVTNGVAMRTIEILDYLNVGGNAMVSTGSDVVVLGGDFITSNQLNFTNGFIGLSGGASAYPDITQVTLNSGVYSGVSGSISALTISGATVAYSGALTVGTFILNTGSYTGGTVSGTNVTVAGGTYTVTSTTTSQDFSIGGGTVASPTTTVGRDLLISGGASTMDSVNVTRNMTMSAGTLTQHTATTTTVVNRMIFGIGNDLTLSGGTVSVVGKGYPFTGSGNGYAYGPTGPSTSLGCYRGNATSGGGGSHAGIGGAGNGGTTAGSAVYGDYRDPNFPGGSGLLEGGGVLRMTANGTCTFNSGGVLNASGAVTGGAGGSIKLVCAGFAGTAGAGALLANGGSSTMASAGAGGGGRIALISTGNEASFTGSFSFPTDGTKMTTMNSVVQARGGVNSGSATYNGGAGTVYLKHSGLTYGGLIVNNGAIPNGVTRMVASVANTAKINASVNANSVKVTSAGTPFTTMVDIFKGETIHIWPISGGNEDPMSGTHTAALLTGNAANTFTSAAAFGGLTIASDNHSYRIVNQLDALYVGGSATLDLQSSDLILTRSSGSLACDFTNVTGGNFAVAAGSKIQAGNNYSSTDCPDSGMTTKTTTIIFAKYCNGLGTCAP